MKQPSVAIILLNWNGYNETIECIEILQKIDYQNYQIILIDNGSRDDSVKILRKRFPQITLLEIQHNRGFAGGANVGLKYAVKNKFDYAVLFNNDARVKKNFLTELVKTAESNKKIGVVGSIIYYLNKKNVIQSAGGYEHFKGLYPFVDPNQGKIDNGQLTEDIFVDTLIGCSLLIKREVMEKIGFLDEKYFIYAEDVDFSIRAKNAGYLLCTAVHSKVWHKVSASSGGGENTPLKLYYNTRNLIYFSGKNLELREKIIFNVYYLLGRVCSIGKLLLQGKYVSVKSIIIGLVHGYIGKTGSYSI